MPIQHQIVVRLHEIVLTKHHETYLFNEGKGMAILFLPSLMIKDEAKRV